VPIVLFLQFNESLVRHKYARHPTTAFRREFNRILWFIESARRVQTQMPLYVAVGGWRNFSAEAHLRRLGVGIVALPFVEPPTWSSLFHHFSFSRIAALSLTQFEKVVVMDNDMVLLGNIDELQYAETPGMVWHTATVLARKERCAVTGGLFVLRPNAAAFARAKQHLYLELNRRSAGAGKGLNVGRRCYDGSDQEFWRSFYRPITELPLRYHAHQNLRLNYSEWKKVRVIHAISGFRRRDRTPDFVHKRMRYFDKESASWAEW
jgi:hypothetical protein